MASKPMTSPWWVRTLQRHSWPTGSRKFTPCHCRVNHGISKSPSGNSQFSNYCSHHFGNDSTYQHPTGAAICLVSNQHSWFYWYLPIAVWFWSLQRCWHLKRHTASLGDHPGPCYRRTQMQMRSQCQSCTTGAKAAAQTVQNRLELIQQK